MADPRVRLKTRVLHADDVDLRGDTLEQLSVFRSPDGSLVSFVTPSIAHLALDAAVRSANMANDRRALIESTYPNRSVFREEVLHLADGTEQGALYDTFLHAMSAAIFSYLSIENFANEVIGRHPDKLVDIIERPRIVRTRKKSERRRERRVSGAAREAEKKSLSIKLSQVLPQITDIPIDKGKAPYQQFQKLERIRDSVIHLKSTTSTPKIKDLGKVPKQPLWADFLRQDSLWMPETALQIIEHFWIDSMPLDWLSDVGAQIRKTEQTGG